jgi:hypothetical protein
MPAESFQRWWDCSHYHLMPISSIAKIFKTGIKIGTIFIKIILLSGKGRFRLSLKLMLLRKKQMKMMSAGVCAAIFIITSALYAIPPLCIQPTENGYRISMTISAPLLQKEKVNAVSSGGSPVNDNFVKAFIYGFDYDGMIGEPALLSGSFSLAYEGDDPVVGIESVATETVQLEGKLYPIQPPYFYNGANTPPPFTYNPESYLRLVSGPPVAITQRYAYRGQQAAEITVQPLSYDPETNTITVIKQLTITVAMEKPTAVRSLHSREFDRVMRTLFPNLEGIPSEPFITKEKYLIIADTAYVKNADLKRFVEYRGAQYEVKLVSTADVGGTTKEAYRRFILAQEKPAFCLLVGTSFPYWSTAMWNSLNYYVATQVSSWNQKPRPGIALGLFWVTSAAQLANIVNKTIATEAILDTRTRVVLGQGGNDSVMGSLPANHCDNAIVEVNARYFPANTGFEVFNYPSIPGGATRAVDQFNKGCWFSFYNGHGSTTGQEFGWGISNLSSMKNTEYPFVLSCACLTGTFNQNCLAAAAVGNQYGPVTYIGSNGSSSTGQHVLNQGYPEAIMVRKITRNGLAFVYGVNYDSTPKAISHYAGQVSSDLKAMMGWQYHHFGDPAVETMRMVPVTPYIDVTEPADGAAWEHGVTQKVLWKDNLAGNVTIDLYKGDSLLSAIAVSTESDGTFDWIIPKAVAAGPGYHLRITSIDSAALWDTSGTFSIATEYIIQPPYFMSFDDLDSGSAVLPFKYSQSTEDSTDWLVRKGPTPSQAITGPAGDHTSGIGNYIYVEASDNFPNKTAEFVTPNFNVSSASLTLSFWVHMRSTTDAMGSLSLDISIDGAWKTGVLTVTGNQGDEWLQKVVDLAPYAGDRVSIRFSAVTGTSWASDICLDDIRIEETVATVTPDPMAMAKNGITVRGCAIRFFVPAAGANALVNVTLYDAQGRAIKTLVNSRLAAGGHTLPIGEVAAGLYVVTLRGKGFEKSARLVITR